MWQDPGWCGWHADHGSLTGLVAGMYTEGRGTEQPLPPEGSGGLHIRSRGGAVVRAVFPADSLVFQVGETAQILSGGLLEATPHCVLAPAAGGASLCRNSFAVFMQPRWDEPMAPPPAFAQAVAVSGWQNGQDFGAFTVAKFSGYYGGGEGGEEAGGGGPRL